MKTKKYLQENVATQGIYTNKNVHKAKKSISIAAL